MSTALENLLARVEKAKGPSAEIDWLIADMHGDIPAHSVRKVGFDYDWYRRPGDFALWKANDSEGRNASLWQPAKVTASIDAAVALLEEVLPSREWSLRTPTAKSPLYSARVRLNCLQRIAGECRTAPLAIIAAMLQTLAALPSSSQVE